MALNCRHIKDSAIVIGISYEMLEQIDYFCYWNNEAAKLTTQSKQRIIFKWYTIYISYITMDAILLSKNTWNANSNSHCMTGGKMSPSTSDKKFEGNTCNLLFVVVAVILWQSETSKTAHSMAGWSLWHSDGWLFHFLFIHWRYSIF